MRSSCRRSIRPQQGHVGWRGAVIAWGLALGACRPSLDDQRRHAAAPLSSSAALTTSSPAAAPPAAASSPAAALAAAPLAESGEAAEGVAPEALAPAARAPLAGAQRLVSLRVAGFRDAVVALPLGARGLRPILVALHGNYDRPEWQCETWGELVRYEAFVLCPRGIPRTDAPKSEDRWTYGGLGATLKELYAALRALREAYPAHADPGPAVFAGFSLGAILGVHALGPEPGSVGVRERGEEPPFQQAVLVEGGASAWHAQRAKRFVAEQGAGVLFACGQHDCRQQGVRAARHLTSAGAVGSVAFQGNVGHTYDGQVAAAIAAALPELLGADPRWAQVVALPAAP